MSSALPNPGQCCSVCGSGESGSAGPAGPQGIPGAAGAAGAAGANGLDAFTTLTSGFTQPIVGGNVTIGVVKSGWMVPGQILNVAGGGDYLLVSTPTSASATIQNLGYPLNAAPAVSVANAGRVGPSGQRGATGAAGTSSADPTTTKGDVGVNNGSGLVRLGVGSNNQALIADSTTSTGWKWALLSLVSSITGVLGIANGGTNAATNTAGFNNLSPVTTRGDLIVRDASNNVRLPLGVANTVLASNGSDPVYGGVTAVMLSGAITRVPCDYILIREDTTAATPLATTWVKRLLSVKAVDTGSHATLASNQITLLAGTYRVTASAPAKNCNNHQLRLWNATDGTAVDYGGNEDATGAAIANRATLFTRFTIAGTKTLELQHYCTNAGTFGTAFAPTRDTFATITLERETV